MSPRRALTPKVLPSRMLIVSPPTAAPFSFVGDTVARRRASLREDPQYRTFQGAHRQLDTFLRPLIRAGQHVNARVRHEHRIFRLDPGDRGVPRNDLVRPEAMPRRRGCEDPTS